MLPRGILKTPEIQRRGRKSGEVVMVKTKVQVTRGASREFNLLSHAELELELVQKLQFMKVRFYFIQGEVFPSTLHFGGTAFHAPLCTSSSFLLFLLPSFFFLWGWEEASLAHIVVVCPVYMEARVSVSLLFNFAVFYNIIMVFSF